MATLKGEFISTAIGEAFTGQQAAAALTKGTITNYDGDNKGTAALDFPAGVVSHDVSTGDDVYVFPLQSVVLVQAADGSVSAGDSLIPDTGKATSASTGDFAFGIAVEASSAADDWILVHLKNHTAL